MCVDEEMSVERFMNVNVDHKCDKIYIESERRKLWAEKFVTFKYESLLIKKIIYNIYSI